jgi:carbonic anhydrase
MDCGLAELFAARNVGAIVPPFDACLDYHDTAL